jgi:tagaturonate reductase
LAEDDIRLQPPVSFPGKLLAFLYERYKAFRGSPESGMIIVPTELLVDNGKKLAGIVTELSMRCQLPPAFLVWLQQHCRFCSSLVDRIVPGKPDAAIAEVYRLWAIEGDERVKSVLSFCAADEGVIIEPDIEIYRELKLRLLNATHTLSCGLAVLAGFTTVKEGMDDPTFAAFVSDLMLREIAPSIPYEPAREKAREFGLKVLDRFRNPHLQHQWMSITMQYSSKMKSRVIPVLLEHYKRHSHAPLRIARGFAGFLLFMKGEKKPGWDDKSPFFTDLWSRCSPDEVVRKALGDENLWGGSLLLLPGFPKAVLEQLDRLIKKI